MTRINRIELMRSLQVVEPGLAQRRELVEQSSCFVFRDGEVITFNDEIACRSQTKLKKFTGAVPAKPLLAILNKMPEDEVEITVTDTEFTVRGEKRETVLRMEAEITLPIDSAEKPGKDWLALPANFVEAVNIVQECAGKDESKFALTCVHLTPKWLEACDNFQMVRYRLKTPLKGNCLVRKDSLKHIGTMELSEFNETDTWIHFRNGDGMILSCRRYLETFPEIDAHLDFEGQPATLPKKLAMAADIAEVLTSENSDSNQVRIDMKAGKLRILGQGNSGVYKEFKKIDYNGPDICFTIAPKLLRELVSKHNECEIGDDKLKVKGDKWIYVASLGTIEKRNGSSDHKKSKKRSDDDE